MPKRILIVLGHPDPAGGHFGNALADAYSRGATQAGHEVKIIDVARLDFPLLRTKQDFETGTPPPAIREAQSAIGWAQHLVIVFPLWLGTMPALLKGFLEQVFRPAFTSDGSAPGPGGTGVLKGRSARIVVTMGMPALVYRWYFRAHGLKSLERGVLRFCGIGPVKESLIGGVESARPGGRERWLDRMQALGRKAS